MRISTNMIFEKGVASMQLQSSRLLQTQQQVATGRRILTPADDPIGAARSLEVTQSKAVNAQFQINQGYAEDSLRFFENRLMGVGDLLQDIRERAVQAGNAALSPGELQFIGTELRARFDAVLGLANSRDASGEYLFAGYQANTAPFEGGLAAVNYVGDQGVRTMQVGASRFMPISFPGDQVFGDMFANLRDFIQALENPPAGGVGDAVSAVLGNIDTALDNVLRVRAIVGSQLSEIDQLRTVGSDLDLQYSETLSRLQDLDFAEAISRLTQQQTFLEAAQQSFLRVSNLSLFNFLN